MQLHGRGEPWADDGIEVGRGDHALSVGFRQPRPGIARKHTLACVPLDLGGRRHDHSHVYGMPHVTRERIDELAPKRAPSGRRSPGGADPLPAPGPAGDPARTGACPRPSLIV
ncbi:hypothetical protein ACFV2Q_19045 [Streptomyces sp. NPDC059650]|uniref:hypothetical protein n=1 Tax=Streptomyces sp. NPDC059650 TaxID=3346896 RepID=UPI0036B439C0